MFGKLKPVRGDASQSALAPVIEPVSDSEPNVKRRGVQSGGKLIPVRQGSRQSRESSRPRVYVVHLVVVRLRLSRTCAALRLDPDEESEVSTSRPTTVC